MLQGVELLYALGAINDQCELTQPLGLQMAEFPLNPMFARMLLLSGTCTCTCTVHVPVCMVHVHV